MRISDWSSDVCSSDLTQRRFRWDAGLHPVLQNLGPEGWLRRQQARSGHVEQEDDLGILLRYGRDCIGAISVEPVESVAPAEMVPSHDAWADAGTGSHRTNSGVHQDRTSVV